MVAEAEFEGKVDFDSAIRPKVLVSRVAPSVRFLSPVGDLQALGAVSDNHGTDRRPAARSERTSFCYATATRARGANITILPGFCES